MILPIDFLTHSRELLEQKKEPSEIRLRNVARNSYYALYHKLSELNISNISKSEQNYGSHELLIQNLRKSDNNDYRKLGLKLAAVKTIRTQADYKITRNFSLHDAQTTLRKVERIFDELAAQKEVNAVSKTQEQQKILTQETIIKEAIKPSRPHFTLVK